MRKDFILQLFIDVTKSEILHVGYWDDSDIVKFENLKNAQWKYVNHVIEKIPVSTKTILDVGCGTGIVANKLADMGYTVDCVNPDLLQKEIFENKYGNKLKLYCCKFEDLDIDKKYDLILMMESLEYIDLVMALKQSMKYLNKNGILIVSDFFRTTEDREYHSFHILNNFIDTLKKFNFKIKLEEDITTRILPTLDVASEIYDNYALPVTKTIIESIASSASKRILSNILLKVFLFMFSKKINKMRYNLFERIPKLLDKQNFLKKVVYRIYLLTNEA
jgi:SAM-dependent methyltransferase